MAGIDGVGRVGIRSYVAPVSLSSIVTNGLVLSLDASNPLSYSGSGTTWTDLSGNGNNGTLTNGTSYSSANGGTLTFDGINDYVDTNIIPNQSAFTYCIWGKSSTTGYPNRIMGNADSLTGLSGAVIFWGITYDSVNKIWFARRSENSNLRDIKSNEITGFSGNWHYIVATYDSVNGSKLYCDNVLVGSNATTGFTSTFKFRIGKDGNGSDAFLGNIAAVQVYNKALSSTEITQNFDATKSRFGFVNNTSGLVMNLDAGDSTSYPGTGTTWTDLIGNGRNGTLIDGVGYSSINGGTLVFNGSNYVSIIGVPLNGVSNFSFDGWFKKNTAPTGSEAIFSFGGEGNNFGNDILMYISSNTLYVQINNGGDGSAMVPFTSLEWTNLQVVYDGTLTGNANRLKIYLNGTLQTLTFTSGFTVPSITSTSSGGNIANVGKYTANNLFFSGNIPVSKLYNKSLTPTEVTTNFNTLKSRFGYASYTTRTAAFATATGITDATILNALNTFDTGLISNGLDTKMKALYPFVGGTSTTHKFNFMNAQDTDAAFRLQFNGGWIHSSTGAKPNNSNGYANTFLTPSTTLTTMSQHISYYSRTNISTVGIGDLGVQDDLAVGASGALYAQYYGNSSQSAVCIQSNDANRIYFTETNSLGFLMGSRTSSTSMKAYRNNLLKGTNTATSTQGIASVPVWIGGFNYRNGSGVYTKYYGIREASFSSIGDGLTDTDASNLYTLVQALQTSLGRQV